ncbi:Allatostatin-A receptor [Toxocara canis]|uniref:Allatostatin-A receptor n=1 Tax=Toxocara canis TaxID=6265 RepID=A0A0B2UYY4_TOXCA|nr:Allatostatin-A receptor [Toxocara canis]
MATLPSLKTAATRGVVGVYAHLSSISNGALCKSIVSGLISVYNRMVDVEGYEFESRLPTTFSFVFQKRRTEDRCAVMVEIHLTVVPVVYCFIMIVGVIGNAAVLTVFALNRTLHNSTNTLITNLAFADLMFLMFCVPFTVYSYAKPWPFPDAFCYLTIYLQYVTAYASVWTLVILALDRFLAVVCPVTAMHVRNMRNVVRACALMWILNLLCNLPALRNIGVFRYEFEGQQLGTCVDSVAIALTSATKTEAIAFFVGFNVGAYVMPLGIICVLYVMMVRSLWRSKEGLKVSKEAFKVKRRITKLVWVIILTFAICWLPQNIRFALKAAYYPEPIFWETEDSNFFFAVQTSFQLLAYANSCINPILYGAMSERFRDAFRQLCHCKKSSLLMEESHMSIYANSRPRPHKPGGVDSCELISKKKLPKVNNCTQKNCDFSL